MKRFKIYKLNLDGSRVENGPHFQYDAEVAQGHQPEWGLQERLVEASMATEEQVANAIETITVEELGVTFIRYKLRQMYEVVEIDLEDLSQDESYEHQLEKVLAKRRKEYPTAESFLNAYFDGGDEALEELRAARLAVKASNPKPVRD